MLIKLLAMKNAYLKNEDGATAIEYALMAAGISLGIIALVFAFGDQLNEMWTNLSTELEVEAR
jgi:pilus assembly protein Flp/PilA